MSAKKKKGNAAPKPASIYDHNVCAPESLEIDHAMHNQSLIASWLDRVRLYVEAMNNIDRAVMLHWDDERLYLSSIEVEP